MNFLPAFPHFTHHFLECDVLVAGGGPSGVPAAIAAARAGADVILCHDRPMFGGNASSEVRMHIVGANHQRPSADLVLEPRETGIIEEIRLENAMRNPQRSASIFDLILYEKCMAEPRLRFFLNTSVCASTVEEGKIVSAHALRLSTEDAFTIKAKTYIDATGDSGLAISAGAHFLEGREGKEYFGEDLAPEEADSKRLGSTLLFMARKHSQPVPYTPPVWARRFTREDFQCRQAFFRPEQQSYEYGYWWLEWGGELDTIKDNELIRDELLAILLGVWDYIKNHGDHGADHWALDWVGVLPGKRESRRLLGQYVLSERDLMEARSFPDAIAYGGWPIDVHPVRGIDERTVAPCTQTILPYLYEIPLRACVSENVRNLFFAGRNLSASHIAFASTRVMATCAVVGEAVGVAAAYAVRRGVEAHSLANDESIMKEIRQHLLAEDLFLIGEEDHASNDKAHSASIVASSEQVGGAARNVVSGQNRSLHGPSSVSPEKINSGAHRWMSEPKEGFPAWIELSWGTPIDFERLEITFDSGLHRHLALTHSDRYFEKMIWGTGQPELLKEFLIEIETAQGVRSIAQETNYWQRRYTLRPDAVSQITRLRITALSSWGIDHARILRIGIY